MKMKMKNIKKVAGLVVIILSLKYIISRKEPMCSVCG